MVVTALRHTGLDPTYAIGGELVDGATNAHLGAGEFRGAGGGRVGRLLRRLPPRGRRGHQRPARPPRRLRHGRGRGRGYRAFVTTIRPGGLLVVCSDDPGAARLGSGPPAVGCEWSAAGGPPGRPGRSPTSRCRHPVLGTDPRRGWLPPAGVGRAGVVQRAQRRGGTGRLLRRLRVDTGAVLAGLVLSPALGAGSNAQGRPRGGGRRRLRPQPGQGGRRGRRRARGGRRRRSSRRASSRTCTHAPATLPQSSARLWPGPMSSSSSMSMRPGGPRPGVSGQLVADPPSRRPGRARFLPDQAAAPGELARLLRSGDLLITVGAGDITRLGPLVRAELDRQKSQGSC